MFIYGPNSVLERLKTQPNTIQRVYLQPGFSDTTIIALLEKARIPTQLLTKKVIASLELHTRIPVIIAQIPDFVYADFDALLRADTSIVGGRRNRRWNFIFFDRITDPQNVGALIRVAACFGNWAVVLARHKACPVTETVLRVACGGENYVPIAEVSNMPTAMLAARKEGWWLVGFTAQGGKSLPEIKLPFPLCFIFGSEGDGIRHGLDKQLDVKATIPMAGAPLSLNVASACAVACYEAARQEGA